MSPARRQASRRPGAEPPAGELSTYERAKDKLLVGLIAALLLLVSYEARQIGVRQEAIVARLDAFEAARGRQSESLNTRFETVNQRFEDKGRELADHRERIKAVETRVATLSEEILRRLDRIEAKMH